MKKLLVLIMILLSFGLAQTSSGISVSGTGTVYGEPDIAVIELGINLTNPDIDMATQEANDAVKAIMTMLAEAGVEAKDVRTVYFNIWFEEPYESNRKAQYRVNNALSITVRDVNSVGAILSKSIEAGANAVNNIQYAMADTEALAVQARELAMQDAQSKAQQLASLAGVDLGQVVMVNEGSSFGSAPGPAMYEDAALRSSVPVAGGQLAVTVNVQVMFAIQDANP